MKIKITSKCDRGKVRLENEDAFIACTNLEQQVWTDVSMDDFEPLGESGALVVVADGVGGANAGEIASEIAIKQTKRCFALDEVKKTIEEQNCEKLMLKAIKEADDAINEAVLNKLEFMGMGTTIVMAWVLDGKAHVAWCGDSRCYLFNPKRGLRRISNDHSLVQELIDKGELTEENAVMHPDSNIITRGLGDLDTDNEPETITIDIITGDMLLLCSDGLCGYCTDKAILRQLNRHCTDLDTCVERLYDMAMKQGGLDNITIALLSIIDDHANRPPKPSFWKRVLDWM